MRESEKPTCSPTFCTGLYKHAPHLRACLLESILVRGTSGGSRE
jgi:hypothetical protein